MDVAITGSSGLIGKALRTALTEAGHRPIRLVRRPVRGEDEISYDPAAGELDGESLEGIDAFVNLAGAGIGDRRWTESYKKLLVDSRVDTTSLLATTIAGLDSKPSVLVSGSAMGIYGDCGDRLVDESTAPADDFLARLCQKWEAAARPAVEAGIRTAFIRTGLVLSPHGGALAKQLPLFKFGLGGKLGSGDQYWSWISLDDQVAAILHLLENDVDGPVNMAAPNPVTNATFTKVLGRVLSRPTLLPVPEFGPKLVLGRELAEALLFVSCRMDNDVLSESGYTFVHPELEVALRDLLDRH